MAWHHLNQDRNASVFIQINEGALIFPPIYNIIIHFLFAFCTFQLFCDPLIVRTANTKTAYNEGCLYKQTALIQSTKILLNKYYFDLLTIWLHAFDGLFMHLLYASQKVIRLIKVSIFKENGKLIYKKSQSLFITQCFGSSKQKYLESNVHNYISDLYQKTSSLIAAQ